jgi:hypothetical protein
MSMTIGSVTVAQWDLGDPENPVTGTESVSGSGAAYHVFQVLQTLESQALLPWPTWILAEGSVALTSVAVDGDSFTYSFSDSPEGGETAVQKLYAHLTTIAERRYAQLKSMADASVAIGSLCSYIATNAVLTAATANIPATVAGDGLQNGTTHPLVPKTITVTGGIS